MAVKPDDAAPTSATASATVAAPKGRADDKPPAAAEVPAETPPAPTAPVGAQEVLSGPAQAAARGELHGTIEHNTAARDKAAG